MFGFVGSIDLCGLALDFQKSGFLLQWRLDYQGVLVVGEKLNGRCCRSRRARSDMQLRGLAGLCGKIDRLHVVPRQQRVAHKQMSDVFQVVSRTLIFRPLEGL